jgi:hypothetical protein
MQNQMVQTISAVLMGRVNAPESAIHEASRAILEALKEPTQEMISSGGQCLSPSHTLTECYDYFREAWRAAIERALRED